MVETENREALNPADESSGAPPVSEAELTALALKDPPPDDFDGSETKPESPFSAPSRTGWLAALAAGLLAALFVYLPKTQSGEIARQRSPDGTGDAILMQFSAGAAADGRSYKVCMQRPSGIKFVPNNCREVAYLGGVSTESGSQPVTLIWTTSSQLEIRYVNASSVHVYQPVFTWGSMRYATRMGNIRPIVIKAVQVGHADEGPSVQPR
jgi:hypothetical protein